MSTTPLGGFLAIPVNDIHPSPDNPRDALHDIDGLALSIKARGLIQPLVVQRIPGRSGVRIVAGHRRHAAVQRLGWTAVPCIVRRDMLPDEELLAMLVENGQRAGLDPIEEARALKQLVNSGMKVAEVAQEIGRPGSYVSGRLMLLELPVGEQEEVRAGHFTLTYATNTVRAARKAQREKQSPTQRPVGRPKGATTKPYFGDTHPLAGTVRARCDHRGTPKVAGTGCGPCWEAVLREDALAGRAVAS